MTAVPFVRVVVLNYDGGEMTIDCLRSLRATRWPADRLEILMVDNGSVDGIAERVKAEMPEVRVLEPFSNLGFAAGCNLGLAATGHYDHAALINNDATVDPNWLAPLVAAVESAPNIGAACSKMLFDGRFQELRVEVPDARSPGGSETRRLGARITAVRIDSVRDDARLGTDEGFHPPEPPRDDLGEELSWWSGRLGSVRIRLASGDCRSATARVASVRLSAERRKRVVLHAGGAPLDVIVDTTPRWFEVELDPEPFDVIQNVGSCLFAGGYGGDRGFFEPDRGQYDEPGEVFAWCGGAVLLKGQYLTEVGMFDQRLFLYYEDTDLSWRGRLSGWRYLYEPGSIVRHRHAASSGGPASWVFQYHTGRNRLLVLLKNAPAPVVARAGAVYARQLIGRLRADVLWPLVSARVPHLRFLRPELRIVAGLARLAPAMLADRFRQRPVVDRSALMAWEQTKDGMA